jgi:WD40 repeat protein
MVGVGIPGATPFGGHSGPVRCLAFSPAGTSFATGGDDGVLRLWDAATGEETAQLSGHAGWVGSVAYHPDGITVVSCAADRSVRVWDTTTRTQVARLHGHTAEVQSVAYSPDGATIVSGGRDEFLLVFDSRTGQPRGELTGHTDIIKGVAYSPNGRIIATAGVNGTDGSVRLWDTATGQQVTPPIAHTGATWAVAFSPDGALLATGGYGGSVLLWDATYRRQVGEMAGHPDVVFAVAYSPDGTTLATAGLDGSIRLWDTYTCRRKVDLSGHDGIVQAMAYSPDGTTLVTGGEDGTIRLWDVATGELRIPFSWHPGVVGAVAYSRDGGTIATGGADGMVRLWDATTGDETGRIGGFPEPVRDIAYSPDGSSLTAAANQTVVLSDLSDSVEELSELSRWPVAYSPDGATLVTAGWESVASGSNSLRLWDVSAKQHRALLAEDVSAVAYSPDGTTIATGGPDGMVRLWDAVTGAQTGRLAGHTDSVNAVAYSPDGTTIAAASDDHTIRLWDAVTGAQTGRLAGHTDSVNAVAYSPDGTTMATAGEDRTIRLWDTASRLERTQLTGHIGGVLAVAYSPDGTTIASAGTDGTIRIWNPRNGAQVNGTGFGVPRARSRPLAGVRSDSASAEDLLGVSGDVETLAELIAATETRPPLAVALIGDWGAGKSSLMLQVERKINELADQSRNNPGLSAFAENIRQVRFNAWHYSDSHLWAGLVSHLFQALAAPDVRKDGDRPTDPSALRVQREKLRAELDAKQAASARLGAELAAADQLPQPGGALAWLGSPRYVGRVILIAARQTFGDVRASLAALLGWAVLGAAAYIAWRFLGAWIGAAAIAAAVAMTPAALAFRRLRSWHRELLSLVDEQRHDLAARQQTAQADIRQLTDQLRLVDAAARLAGFLDERGAPSAYGEYQGLLGRVHADLSQLSATLVQARGEWVASGALDPAPLQRIVLYIDDLDRCQPGQVVEMLQAVHLMLALDLFVVVVAVDARWLIRSLKYRYHDLFHANGMSNDEDGLASPVNYLDKIFQIPYVLLPPAPPATAQFLRALLPKSMPEQPLLDSAPRSASENANIGAVSTSQDATALGEPKTDDPAKTAAAGEPVQDPELATKSDLANGLDRRRRDRRMPNEPLDSPGLINLRPPGLQVSQPEVEFLAGLGRLVPNPRAAKRMVNIYRLVRIGIPDADLVAFIGNQDGGPYQTVQVLLAILTGSPSYASEVFRALLNAADEDDVVAVVEAAGTSRDNHQIRRIGQEIARLRSETGLSITIPECRRWSATLARFSFHTRHLVPGTLLTGPDGLAELDGT